MKQQNSGYSIFVVTVCIMTAIFPGGLHLSLINPIIPQLRQFINESHVELYGSPAPVESIDIQINLAQSLLIAGTAIGSLAAKFLLPHFSRKNVFIAMNVTALLATTLMAPVTYLGRAFAAFIVGRFVLGLSRGVFLVLVPLVLNEVTTRASLVKFQNMIPASINLSLIIGNVLGLPQVLGTQRWWPLLFGLTGLFPLAFFVLLPWYPNTVTWLILQERGRNDVTANRDRASYRMLRRLRAGDDDVVEAEFDQKLKEVEADWKFQGMGLKAIWNTPHYRRQIVAAVVVMCGLQTAGIQFIIQYTNAIFESAGINPQYSTYYTIGIFCGMNFIIFVNIKLVHRFGSRACFLCGQLTVSCGHVLLIVSTQHSDSNAALAYVGVVSVVVILLGLASGSVVGFGVMPSEMTTQVTRPVTFSFAITIFWTFAAIVTFVTPYTVAAWRGLAYLPFLVMTLMTAVFVKFYVPDMRNKSVEEIQSFFRDDKKESEGIVLENPMATGYSDPSMG